MSARGNRPPRLAEWILERSLPARERGEVLGDLAEQYGRRAERSSAIRASIWYWRHALETPTRLMGARLRAATSMQELVYAARALRKSPGFALVAVLSLGLGIGANTAIYSSMRALLYTDLPVDRPGELQFLYHERPERSSISQFGSGQTTDPATGADVHSNLSYPGYAAVRAAAAPDLDVAGFAFLGEVSISVEGQPAAAAVAQLVSGNFFSTLAVPMHLGRSMSPGEDNLGGRDEAVLSHAFWQRAFGGDASVLNRDVRVNGHQFTVVGVTQAGFMGLSPGGFFQPTDISVPFAAEGRLAPKWARGEGSLLTSTQMYWVRPIARLETGPPRAPLREAMTVALRAEMGAGGAIAPEAAGDVEVRFLPARRGLDSLRAGTERPLRMLAVVAGFVLLIACLNIANLLLARGAARHREMAVRRALGAGRARLIRQLFLENLLIGVGGAAAGLLFAVVSGPAITVAVAARLGPTAVRPELDLGMLSITGAVTTFAVLVFGILPAIRLSRAEAYEALSSRGATDGGRSRVGRALIAVQIAASIPLIVGAGLFLRTLDNLGDVELGFETDNIVMFRLDPELVTDDVDRSLDIIRQVTADLRAVPGVQSVGILGNALLSGWVSNGSVTVDEVSHGMFWNRAGADTFTTMGIDLRAGRPLLATDDEAAPPVVVINETAQAKLFDGRALGRTLGWGGQEWEVVGVVADTRYRSVRAEVPPMFFHSYQQRPSFAVHVILRTAVPPGQLGRTIAQTVATVDAGLPVTGLRTQAEQTLASVQREVVFAQLLAGFSAFALLIACVGLYGITSYAVARRRPELGVRIALGARPEQIVSLVIGQVLAVAALGIAVGVGAAYMLGPLIDSMLYGIAAGDATMFVTASLFMAATAIAAAWIPALRAARTDALAVLNED
jgi:predicted permease